MHYQITLWTLDRADERESGFDCTCETYHSAVAAFEAIIRGTSGHYKAWLVDLKEGREIRYSSVTYAGPGAR